MSLDHDERIGLEVLPRDVPRISGAFAPAADAQALALSDRVVHEPLVLAHALAFRRRHRARLLRQVTRQEFAERPLADEADAGGVALGVVRQARFAREPAHIGLEQVAQGKHRARELRLREPVEEIALVLAGVEALQQDEAPIALFDARVVAGGDALGAERQCMVEERLELDLGVAHHVGVGRAPRAVLREEAREHALTVFGGEVHRLDLDADLFRDRHRIDEILARGAVAVVVVVLPVLHEEADHVVSRALQQQRRDGGIHASGQSDDDLHWNDSTWPRKNESGAEAPLSHIGKR
jgi:hypothetical protein